MLRNKWKKKHDWIDQIVYCYILYIKLKLKLIKVLFKTSEVCILFIRLFKN